MRLLNEAREELNANGYLSDDMRSRLEAAGITAVDYEVYLSNTNEEFKP